MVVFFDKDGNIVQSEDNVMKPTFPARMSTIEQVIYYNEQGLDFVCLNYELGISIFDYKVARDEDTNFIGLIPIKTEVI